VAASAERGRIRREAGAAQIRVRSAGDTNQAKATPTSRWIAIANIATAPTVKATVRQG